MLLHLDNNTTLASVCEAQTLWVKYTHCTMWTYTALCTSGEVRRVHAHIHRTPHTESQRYTCGQRGLWRSISKKKVQTVSMRASALLQYGVTSMCSPLGFYQMDSQIVRAAKRWNVKHEIYLKWIKKTCRFSALGIDDHHTKSHYDRSWGHNFVVSVSKIALKVQRRCPRNAHTRWPMVFVAAITSGTHRHEIQWIIRSCTHNWPRYF